MPSIGPQELIIVLVIALLVVGPGKLPQLGSALGRTVRELRDALEGDTRPAPAAVAIKTQDVEQA